VEDPPERVKPRIDVQLAAGERADLAAVAVLKALLGVIAANLPGTIADLDPEFLHDFRVAIRRSRAVQRELADVFPRHELRHWRRELRWLQQVTGEARDMDVYVLEFDDFRALVAEELRPDLEPLRSVLQTRRLAARRAMVQELRSERAARALEDWGVFLDRIAAAAGAGGPGALAGETRQPAGDRAPLAAEPIAAVAGARIAKVYRRMVRMGGAIDDTSPAQEYHELRKQGKELRYLLELFGAPLFDAEVVEEMVRTLKALQDTLGRHQDREVQAATVRAVAAEVAARAGGAQALLAMGALVERLRQDERAARAEFARRFKAFAAAEQRRRVGREFAP
jgi:CHAD domain-containing protein